MEKKQELETIAKELLEKEILFQSDLERLIGKRPFDRKTTYEAFTDGDFNNEEVEEAPKAETEEVASSNGQSEATKEEKTEEGTSV